ncbi:MAG TPA: hypothetical protein VMX17_10160 [Candidatus Glassbacteria bacterium]|nr:hypothetical protein [Candidatus Glassbacteria bacterium]
MYTISEKVLNEILKKKASSLVGRSCKRIEVIRDNPDLGINTKCNLIKDLIKENIYESMRDIEETILAFSEGANINVNFEKPVSK